VGARGARPFFCRALVPARGSGQRQGGSQPPLPEGKYSFRKSWFLGFTKLIPAIPQNQNRDRLGIIIE
ncbi:MAG: hypothetical protein ACOCVU_03575, partial [Desulfohalobiaceae bacterium]